MNFSDAFKQSGQLCRFSPDGVWLANAVQHRLVVRDVETLVIGRLFTCLDAIQHIEWSPDSQLIVCGMYKRSLVQVNLFICLYFSIYVLCKLSGVQVSVVF